MNAREAVLMVNVGSPEAPTTAAVRTYLRQFLSDPRVIDLPAFQRWLLVNLVILPTRPKKSAHAYAAVWRPEGAPLVHFSRLQQQALERKTGKRVLLAMGYGRPSLVEAAAQLDGVERLTVLPMFPQYASATVGSVLEGVYRTLAKRTVVPAVRVVPPFYSDDAFLDALAAVIRRSVAGAEHLLLSYHGLPERQVMAVDPGCLRSDDCCARLPAGCYRAQCRAMSRSLAERVEPLTLSMSFQSRLGREKWLSPSTETHVEELARKGITRLAVACPSFVADCLESLEEIGLQLKARFLKAGGKQFTLVPCVNDDPAFIDALAKYVA